MSLCRWHTYERKLYFWDKQVQEGADECTWYDWPWKYGIFYRDGDFALCEGNYYAPTEVWTGAAEEILVDEL